VNDSAAELAGRLSAGMEQVLVGADRMTLGLTVALLARSHVLIEGVPGTGKTLAVRAFAVLLGLEFRRIAFTPDLMPSDVVGTTVFNPQTAQFTTRTGPIVANIVLADEVNRTPPKTQSALLEAMQEHSVTIAGTIHKLEEPFFVLATQNPIEQEGTYPLPEAQLDRFFFKLMVPFCTREDLNLILDRTTRNEWPKVEKVMDGDEVMKWQGLVREVLVAAPVQDYAIRLLLATHPQSEFAPAVTNKYIRLGGSPRGVQALTLAAKVQALLAGRFNVSFEDIRKVYLPALRHRVLLNFEAQAENIASDSILAQIIQDVPETEGKGKAP
jgi:MoxR-like ATPase